MSSFSIKSAMITFQLIYFNPTFETATFDIQGKWNWTFLKNCINTSTLALLSKEQEINCKKKQTRIDTFKMMQMNIQEK